jgi:hypothetical protein
MPEIVEPEIDPAANDRLPAAQRLSMKGKTPAKNTGVTSL